MHAILGYTCTLLLCTPEEATKYGRLVTAFLHVLIADAITHVYQPR